MTTPGDPFEQPPPQQGPPPPAYPPGAYPQVYGPAAPTNTLAIISLVTAFLCSPVGLVTGILALGQIKERRENGHGLAVAGIVVSAFSIVAGFVLVLALFALGTTVKSDFNKTCSAIPTNQEPSQPTFAPC